MPVAPSCGNNFPNLAATAFTWADATPSTHNAEPCAGIPAWSPLRHSPPPPDLPERAGKRVFSNVMTNTRSTSELPYSSSGGVRICPPTRARSLANPNQMADAEVRTLRPSGVHTFPESPGNTKPSDPITQEVRTPLAKPK